MLSAKSINLQLIIITVSACIFLHKLYVPITIEMITVSSEGRALSQLPEFEIAGPDWETFEDIETYVRGEAGGFLRTFLPKRVWLYLWAPTAANRQTIQLHRQESVPHKASSASCFCGLSSVSKRLY